MLNSLVTFSDQIEEFETVPASLNDSCSFFFLKDRLQSAILIPGKGVCKYLGGQNGVTVSVVSTSVLGCGNANANAGPHSIGIGIGGILAANAADIDDPEDSDGEISKIDFRGVNLRSKKKRDVSGNQNGDKLADGDANGDGGGCCDDNSQQQPERPMSWEGELSDQEMSSNTITNQVGIASRKACGKRISDVDGYFISLSLGRLIYTCLNYEQPVRLNYQNFPRDRK